MDDCRIINSSGVTVRLILAFCWAYYVERNLVRDVVLWEVGKTLGCYEEGGCFVFFCKGCDGYVFRRYGCNSRLCSCCGKRYADGWALSLSRGMFPVAHRHLVLSVPDVLWSFLRGDRMRWKDYMDCAIELCDDYFPKLVNGAIRVGVIVFLHPFGKDMRFQPHLHLLITEGGFDKAGRFVSRPFIPADGFRKSWQYHVLEKFQSIGLDNGIASYCYQKYKKGFYVWLHKAGRIRHPRVIARYVGRYVRHPAIANSRIDWFDKQEGKVGFHYEDSNKKRHDVVMTTDEFITSLIQHVPEKHFKMIRYYGAYARRNKRKYGARVLSSIKQLKLTKFGFIKPTLCPICRKPMQFITYLKKPPPPDKQKLEYWVNQTIRKLKN